MLLDKQKSGERWCELRDLWNEFDPIGVNSIEGWPKNEYDNYLGPTLRLLERGATHAEIQSYLEYVVGEYMGLEEAGVQRARSSNFAGKLQEWFSSRWQGTHV
jgi:hypothetical protein